MKHPRYSAGDTCMTMGMKKKKKTCRVHPPHPLIAKRRRRTNARSKDKPKKYGRCVRPSGPPPARLCISAEPETNEGTSCHNDPPLFTRDETHHPLLTGPSSGPVMGTSTAPYSAHFARSSGETGGAAEPGVLGRGGIGYVSGPSGEGTVGAGTVGAGAGMSATG